MRSVRARHAVPRFSVSVLAAPAAPQRGTEAAKTYIVNRERVMKTEASEDPKRAERKDDCGLHVLRVGERVVLDVILPENGKALMFLRIDGQLYGELPVAGTA